MIHTTPPSLVNEAPAPLITNVLQVIMIGETILIVPDISVSDLTFTKSFTVMVLVVLMTTSSVVVGTWLSTQFAFSVQKPPDEGSQVTVAPCAGAMLMQSHSSKSKYPREEHLQKLEASPDDEEAHKETSVSE